MALMRYKALSTQSAGPETSTLRLVHPSSAFDIFITARDTCLQQQLLLQQLPGLVVWHSSNAFHPINEVTLHRARIVLGVTACGQVNDRGT